MSPPSAVFGVWHHSLMDFDLSYISMLLLLAMAFGIVASRSSVAAAPDADADADAAAVAAPESPGSVLWTKGVAALAVVGILLTTPLGVSATLLRIGGNPTLALWTDPLSPAPRERMSSLEAASRLDPYNFVYYLRRADLALAQRRWDDAAVLTDRALALAPVEPGINEAAANQYWQPVAALIQAGDMTAARQRAERVIAFQSGLDERIRHAAPYRGIWTQEIGYTPLIRLRVGQALALLGRWGEAAPHLRAAAADSKFAAEAGQWLDKQQHGGG